MSDALTNLYSLASNDQNEFLAEWDDADQTMYILGCYDMPMTAVLYSWANQANQLPANTYITFDKKIKFGGVPAEAFQNMWSELPPNGRGEGDWGDNTDLALTNNIIFNFTINRKDDDGTTRGSRSIPITAELNYEIGDPSDPSWAMNLYDALGEDNFNPTQTDTITGEIIFRFSYYQSQE